MKEVLGPGDAIGNYVIDECIGRGSLGRVYRAHPQDIDDYPVAIKLLDPRYGMFSPEELEEAHDRWRIEYNAMGRIKHPNVVGILHPGLHKGTPYICMEYIEGATLHAVLRSRPLSVREGLLIAKEVAGGLSALHEAGVVHRDLKPLNVMLETTGRPILIDLGISVLADKKATRITQDGMMLGTPGYVPPELFRGESPEKTADIYALGVLALELMGGRAKLFDPRTVDFDTVDLSALLHVDLDHITRSRGPGYQYLVDLLDPLVADDPDYRPTADECVQMFDWAARRHRHDETRKFTRPVADTPLQCLMEEAATMTRDEFLDIHQEVRGVLVTPHCDAQIDDPLSTPRPCTCENHLVTAMHGQPVIIGRRAQIGIDSERISREHARLQLSGLRSFGSTDYKMLIEDLGSTNGTFVNGHLLVGRHVLRSRDEINLANTKTLRWEYLAGLYARVNDEARGTGRNRMNGSA